MKKRVKTFYARIKAKLKSEAEIKQSRKSRALKKAEFNMPHVPEGMIALPFNHVITIRNAHALYQSFKAVGQECVLIDMSGGDLLTSAKQNGTYNADYNYLVFDFDNLDEASYTLSECKPYFPSIPDITKFTEICRAFYPTLEGYLNKTTKCDEDDFLLKAYESYEAFFEKSQFCLPIRISSRSEFTEILTRHWFANIVTFISAGEANLSKVFNQAWALNRKYLRGAQDHDLKSQKFEQFILDHKFSRAVHFCGPYTLQGVLIKYAFHNIRLPCTLFHDAFMPPEQMKKINNNLSSFKTGRVQVDILYKDRSEQPAYDLKPASEQVTLRYPVRTWASYDILGVPQDYLWASWLEYPLENVGVKNTAIAEKFTAALGSNRRVKVVGNPLIETTLEIPPEVSSDRPNLLVSVAPDIFSAIRFKSTKYLTSMEDYFEELKRIISIYAETANVIIALHPRLTFENPHYELMSQLGRLAETSTGKLLPHADLFLTYVGSVMNFDADELNVPMLALSLYDDAKSYSQNQYKFADMHMIETEDDMAVWEANPADITLRADKVIPTIGSSARELMALWSTLET